MRKSRTFKFAVGDNVQLKKDISEDQRFVFLRIRESFGKGPLIIEQISFNEYEEAPYFVSNSTGAAWMEEEWLEPLNEAKMSITSEDLMEIL